MLIFWVQFLIFLLVVLVLFWFLLGDFWVSWGSLGGPLDPKIIKNCRFFKVFENAAFWLFEAPDGSLGLILPPLWPIWSQNGPQNGSQKCSKKEPKIDLFFLFFFSKWMLINIRSQLKPKLGPKMDQGFCTKFQKDLQEKPRWAQEGHHEL